MKKILIIIDALDVGGAEMDIIRNFSVLNQEADFDMSVFTYHHRGALADLSEENGLPVDLPKIGKIITLLQKLPLIKQLLTILLIRQKIKQDRPDIIHSFLLRPYFYSAIAYLLMGKKNRPIFIMSRLNLNFHQQKYPLMAVIETKICHPLCDKVVGNSKAILQDLSDEGIAPHRQYLIYNGIDTTQFTMNRKASFYHQKPFTLTAIGNLHSYKGYDDLLNAVQILQAKSQELQFKLLIAGRDESDNLARYQQFITAHKLVPYIEFIGHCDDILSFLAKSHLHLHPSHTEGLPNAIIEAMSAELPVIACNVGGIPELITHQENGLLVEPCAPQQLADAIKTLLAQPETMYRYGQRGKQKADACFHISNSLAAYRQLYGESAQ
ncbi:MAG: glycosyltransferase [Alphaproteobacteria bacterium]|nr:glycosyltransferase [Alphaproteobacteria bacterium]